MATKRTNTRKAAPKRASLDPTRVVGRPGLKAWAGRISEEWDPTLKGTRGVKLYREMADSEPVLAAVMFMITGLLQQVEVYTEPADESALSQEAAQFLEECLEDTEHTWEDFIAEALTMLPFGWSYFEPVYKYRRGDLPRALGASSKHSDNRIGWDRIELRAQDSLLRWEIDDEGRVLGMWQNPPPDFRVAFIPVEKAVHFRWRATKNNPEGKSAFRAAKRPYLFKRSLEEVEAVGIERDLAGLPVLEAPPEYLSETASAEDKAFIDGLFRMVQSIRRDEQEAALVPSEEYTDASGTAQKTGWKLKLLTSGGSRQVNTDVTIQRYEHRMLMSLLSEFLMLGANGGGSLALARDKSDLMVVSLTSIIDAILATFNREAVARLMRLNGFPPGVWPRLEHGDVEAPSLTEMAAYVSQLIGAGALTPDDGLEKKLRQYGSLPQLGEGEEETPVAAPERMLPEGDPAGEELATTALNGAQVASAHQIVLDVRAGLVPKDTALEELQAFFSLTREQAERILAPVDAVAPEEPEDLPGVGDGPRQA